MNHRINVKHKSTKLLEDSIRENLDDLVYDSNVLDAISKAQSIKEIINKLDFLKSINICSARDTVKRMRKTVYKLGESMCEIHIYLRTVIHNK